MRKLESAILSSDTVLNKYAVDAIDSYENEMLKNIYSYSKTNQFDKAIFMCGVAHRKSIIEKINKFNANEDIKLDWQVLNF